MKGTWHADDEQTMLLSRTNGTAGSLARIQVPYVIHSGSLRLKLVVVSNATGPGHVQVSPCALVLVALMFD